MNRLIYIDTSVVGGYFDEEFAKDTIPFFDAIRAGEGILIVSDLLVAELSRAPAFVKNLLDELPSEVKLQVKLTQDAAILADKYIEAGVVGRTSRADCQHIAIATLSRADVLVSWSFKHIVNLDRIRGYNGISY